MVKEISSAQPIFQSTVQRSESLKQKSEIEKVIEQQEKPQQKILKEDLEKVVNGINDFLKPSNTHLKFEFHDELKEYFVSIVDNETNEVVKEIPPKKLLDMYAAMTEYLGLLVDNKI